MIKYLFIAGMWAVYLTFIAYMSVANFGYDGGGDRGSMAFGMALISFFVVPVLSIFSIASLFVKSKRQLDLGMIINTLVVFASMSYLILMYLIATGDGLPRYIANIIFF